jgi:hypothetical protein
MKLKQITFNNIRGFLQGHYRTLLKDFYPEALPEHIEEQFIYRCEAAKECLELGECKHCGCSTPEKFLSDDACENDPPCYGKMLSKKDWELFKLDL